MCRKGRWSLEPFYVREIVKFSEKKPCLSSRELARALKISHQSVLRVLEQVTSLGLDSVTTEKLSDSDLDGLIHPIVGRPQDRKKVEPDFGELVKELKGHKHLTKFMLYGEYLEKVGESNAYSYSWFCEKFKQLSSDLDIAMVLNHLPGEKAMVDYAGDTVPIYNQLTGLVDYKAQIFVMTLAFSGFIYAEAQRSQEMENFLMGNAKGFQYFGGVTQKLIMDNLKAAVISNTKKETLLTRSFLEMCDHFDCIPDPARTYHPKDKAMVEKSVYLLESHILAAIRHKRYHSLVELNCDIAELLEKLNKKAFRKTDGSRSSRFNEIEKASLKPLPLDNYEYGLWSRSRVLSNYHVKAGSNYYSVPFSFRNSIVDIKLTENLVRVFADNIHIATHQRSNKCGSYITDNSHMPMAHIAYLADPLIEIEKSASEIGPATYELIKHIISERVTQNGIKQARYVLRLGKIYGYSELEMASELCLDISSPTKTSVESILTKGISRDCSSRALPVMEPSVEHMNLRSPSELVVSK